MANFLKLGAETCDLMSFVRFWSSLYSYGDDDYLAHIRLGEELRREDVRALLRWKAGARHAARARKVADKVDLVALNTFRARSVVEDADIEDFFLRTAKPTTRTGIIWPITICHLARPHDVPIYDVNVWHAWGFIEGWLEPRHLSQVPIKFGTYLGGYRPFFLQLQSDLDRHGPDSALRNLDRALFRFGQFMKSQLGRKLALGG